MSVFCVSMKNSIQKEKLLSSGLSLVSPLCFLLSLISVINWMFPAVDFRYLYIHYSQYDPIWGGGGGGGIKYPRKCYPS